MKTAEPYEIVKVGDYEVSHCASKEILHITLPNGKEYCIQATSDGMMINTNSTIHTEIRAFQSQSDLGTIFVE
jgi:hypothetical protein